MTGKYKIRLYLLIILCLAIVLYSVKDAATSFLLGTDVVLSSPMEGTITYEGKPAANAKISRTIVWKWDEGETDIFFSNDAGEFNLPRKNIRTRIPLLAEFVITQEVHVFYQGKDSMIWYKAKRDLGEYGELGGKPMNLRCELTQETIRIEGYHGLFGTSCQWDSIENRRI